MEDSLLDSKDQENLKKEQEQLEINVRLKLKETVASNRQNRPDPNTFSKLDGSIKKNTSFIKKLKAGINASQFELLKRELLSLKLEKYLEEIALSIAEGIHKTSADILATVEICLLLDHRFESFMRMLLPNLVKTLKSLSSVSIGEKEDPQRLLRLKSCMRLLIELNLIGLAADGPKQKIVPGVLHELFSADKTHININLAVSFVRFYYIFYVPYDILSLDLEGRDDLTSETIRADCQKVLQSYFKLIKNTLVKEHEKIKRQEKLNQDSFIARGEVSEDRQETYEKRVKQFEKLKAVTQVLSSYLKLDMPELAQDEQVTRMTIGITDGKTIIGRGEEGSGTGLWEDDESKSFYENITDLSNLVPAILLGQKSASSGAVDVHPTEDGNNEKNDNYNESVLEEEPKIDEKMETKAFLSENQEVEETSDKVEVSGAQIAFASLTSKLVNCLSRDAVEQLAIEFIYINNKGTRRQLIQALLGVSRQRLDLLPYYSSLIATLNPYWSEIGTAVVEELESSFHRHQKRKDQIFIEEKLKNIRFIGELTKFGITPSHVVFHCIKVLLDDFNFHNIELLCSLLETCGRYLFFTPETNVRTANYIDILLRKKAVQNLDTKYSFMIDNAVYACNPPEAPVVAKKVRDPIELFLRKLIYRDLKRSSVEKILKLLRKLDWNHSLTQKIVKKIFYKIWKVKFSNLHLMAFLVAELSRFYPSFGVAVVDNALENVRIGLERNIFKHNQRRIAVVKFFGELYNYRMVDSGTIFDTLYLLLRFGHVNGIPIPDVVCQLDLPSDFFRLRLVCTLLDTCGSCFKKGSSGKKLDNFLVFMQMYIFTKDPIPIDAEFFIMETIELLRPKLQLIPSYEESVNQVNAIARTELQDGVQEEDQDEDDQPTIHQEDEEDNQIMEEEEEDLDDDIYDDGDSEEEEEYVEEEEEEVVVHMAELESDSDQDELFERDFGRLMQESIDSRRTERKAAMFDAPIPSRKQLSEESKTVNDDEIVFSFLTRRGNKQQAKQMMLPASSAFAVKTLTKQQEEEEERIRLKKLVLNYQAEQAHNGIHPEPSPVVQPGHSVPILKRIQERTKWSNTSDRKVA